QRVLREWIRSGESERIVAAAHLLRGFEHSVVFDLADFVAEMLEAAAAVGSECHARTASELYALAIGGLFTGTPGQPAPRYLSDKKEAQRLAARFKSRPAVRAFYESLVSHAENSIRRDLDEFEEEDE